MRTVEEIAKRITESDSMFGFDIEVLIVYLPFELAKLMLKPEITAENWKVDPLERDSTIDKMRNYAKFGWEKILTHRGISASRTIEKMEAWLWVLGEDSIIEEVKKAGYAKYGAPKLAVVCRNFGFDIPDSCGIKRMIDGEPCSAWCEDGCEA